MSFLFGRLARLTIGVPGEQGRLIESFSRDKKTGLITQGLRFTFSIEKTSTPEPNKLTIGIYNLNADSVAITKKRHVTCILEAGYGNILTDGSESDLKPTMEIIFKGDIAKSKTVKSGGDYITTIEQGDGLAAFQNAQFNGSFAPGSGTGGIADSIISAFGLGKGDVQAGGSQYVNGASFTGLARDAMDKIAGKTGSEWSIQNGAVQMVPYNSATKEPAILIDSNSGLIGSPNLSGFSNSREKKFAGVEFSSLLQPGLKPGRRVLIQSKFVNGVYIVRKVKHHGDTRMGPWYSDCEAVAP